MKAMLQHFLVVAAALAMTVWSTVVTEYHEFRGYNALPAPVDTLVIPEVSLAVPETPTVVETVVADLVAGTTSTPQISATSTISVAPSIPVGPVIPSLPSVPFTPLPLPTPPTPVTTTAPGPSPVLPEVDAELSDEALLKSAIVNIICLQGGGLRGSSGTGIMIDPRGVILTVAHVGQNFLLRDYPEPGTGSCYIRTGSPARNTYSAEIVYVSPSWIEENETTFLDSRPRGTGENDFAFLVVTGTLTSTPLPSRFSYIPLSPSDTDIDVGDRVGTGSYAAEFLTSSEVRSSLYPTIKFADVDDVYTFDRDTIDIFSVAAGSAAQEGSSGGAVINRDDYLIGLITTRTVKTDLSLRTLQALTMDHLRRSFRGDVGENMDGYLRQDFPTLIGRFAGAKVELQDILFEAIDDARN
jgi:hypothetical protein